MDSELAARLADIKPGPITALTKEPLLVIAEALAIPVVKTGPDKTKVPQLKALINKALAQPDFVYKDHFQKFLIYNRSRGPTPKTSADKAQQDGLQDKSDEKEPTTAAHKKLLEGTFTTDPDPQYRRLGSEAKKQEEGLEDPGSPNQSASSDSESELSSLDSRGSSRPKVKKPKAKKKAQSKDDVGSPKTDDEISKVGSPSKGESASETDRLPIIVKFNGSNPREVWIAPTERPEVSITKMEETTGSGPSLAKSNAYFASLKKLLPLAIARDSPIKKDQRGKIGIVGATGGHLNLGTVEQFTTGPLPSVLNLSVDQYKLRQIPEGLLCDVFYDPNQTSAEAQQAIAATQSTGSLPFGPQSRPLDVARERAASNQAAKDAEELPLIRFLRTILAGPALPRPAVSTVGEMLTRYLQATNVLKRLKETWSDGPNSFRVPEDYEDDQFSRFRGFKFGTSEVLKALRIGHTTHNNDSRLFRLARLRDDSTGRAEEWVDKPGTEKLDKKFGAMSIKEWESYLDKKKEKGKEEEKRQAKDALKKRKREKGKEPEPERERKVKKHKGVEKVRKDKGRREKQEPGFAATERGSKYLSSFCETQSHMSDDPTSRLAMVGAVSWGRVLRHAGFKGLNLLNTTRLRHGVGHGLRQDLGDYSQDGAPPNSSNLRQFLAEFLDPTAHPLGKKALKMSTAACNHRISLKPVLDLRGLVMESQSRPDKNFVNAGLAKYGWHPPKTMLGSLQTSPELQAAHRQ
ncbi:hypothetical protein B0H17DRAFT_1286359 [Mycena rosella]|uniref:Uncharacterized protein n=1 Tax=Mycena rosella TaxID=1033263 RepID=A0AAD7GJ19_MYCRO|nr:hypothetical protein B0H17DRAFT_1286359 [Mycena rosella]